MVFKNLPIELDSSGQAKLRLGGLADPFGVENLGIASTTGEEVSGEPAFDRERLTREAANNPNARYFEIDPLTRASDRLVSRAIIDFKSRRVLDARIEKTNYRGLEFILAGCSPTDAIHITSRYSGTGSAAHALAASLALEMAMQVTPPPLAIVTRCLGAAAELLASHTRHLFISAGPDYSEQVVRQAKSGLWTKAENEPAAGAAYHGCRTIAELMQGMNPLHGHLYLEALHLTRVAYEVATLIFGKYPHPSSVFPGGLGIEADKETYNQILGRIHRLIDFSKKVTAVWDDLTEFFYSADERHREVGVLPANLISAGIWDDPFSFSARFDNCNSWGEKRLSTPGVIVNGKLRTTRLTEFNAGIEEFADRSYVRQWDGEQVPLDPLAAPLSPLHPWNKHTVPNPQRSHWNGRYSWNTAPRWDREGFETGPLARQWITAVGGKLKNEFIQIIKDNRGGGLEIDLPRFQVPATRLSWRIPERPNAFERNRARAYHVGYCGMVALTYLLKAFDCLQRNEKAMSTRFRVPDQAIGVGLWEEGQGALTHHAVISKGRIANYQVITPSAWMGSPQDAFGKPGPYEQAIINTPLIEEFDKPGDFTGIDLLRAIRSFDP